MNYRQLGNTGLSVGEIALGCEGFLGKSKAEADEMFGIAFDGGVNCMDMYSPNPDLQKLVGGAISSRRKNFVLQSHLCTEWKNGQYRAVRDIKTVQSAFESSLKNYGTDYIDIGMIHYVDSLALWDKILSGGIADYALKLKKQGAIRHIGISSHNPEVALKAAESGIVEVLMFSVNPCYDLLPADEDCNTLWDEKSYSKPLFNIEPSREKLYQTCQRLGVGIDVMKVFGGGDLLTENSPAGRALTPVQCIHYALTRPAVACVMSGVHSKQQLLDSLAYESATEEQRDFAEVFASLPKMSWRGHCMYCGHCAPCPKGIDIATVTKFLNLAKAQGEVPETVREHYSALPAKAGDCIACGACEKRCPFGVFVIQNMAEARIIFGR